MIKNHEVKKLEKGNQHIEQDVFVGHTAEKIFGTIYKAAFNNEFGVAFWREPLSTEINCIINASSRPNWCIPEIEMMNKGFIFSPFENDMLVRIASVTYYVQHKIPDLIPEGCVLPLLPRIIR